MSDRKPSRFEQEGSGIVFTKIVPKSNYEPPYEKGDTEGTITLQSEENS